MILIIPCAGESSRFPGTRPKWMLTQPDGSLMVCDAIKKINMRNVDRIVVIVLKSHVTPDFQISTAFANAGIIPPVDLFLLEEKTKSQPETIAKYLESRSDDFSFFVKDCDGQFRYTPEDKDEVVVADISILRGPDAAAKSYTKSNDKGQMIAIAEKQVISNSFCVGGYSFSSSHNFLKSYEKIKHHENIYVSHIIDYMMLTKIATFTAKECSDYKDWGTLDEWLDYKASFSTYFVDIDGVLVENSAEFFPPFWGTTAAIKQNVDAINDLYDSGTSQIVLTTSRTEQYESDTIAQLYNLGIKYHKIVYGLLHSKRIIVNDFSTTNPYPSCAAISLPRNSPTLKGFLK
jgi:hypothetical protein